MSRSKLRILFLAMALMWNAGEVPAEEQKNQPTQIPVQVGEDRTAAEAIQEGGIDDWDPAWSTWDEMDRMRRKLSRLMNDPWLDPDPSSYLGKRAAGGAAAATDYFETDDEITVKMDVPGFDRSELEIFVENQSLVVRGRKEAEVEEKNDPRQYHYRSRRSGSFERRFALPAYAVVDRIDAAQSNGVLTVRIPKKEAPKPQKIEIRSEESKD